MEKLTVVEAPSGAVEIRVTVPAHMVIGSTVAGEALTIDLRKAHESWVLEFLRYGVQRKINDGSKGDSPAQKLEVARLLVKDIMAGEALPQKVQRRSSVPPLVREARKLADTAIKEALASAGLDVKALYTGLPALERVAKQDKHLAANPALMESATAIMAAREAAQVSLKDARPDNEALLAMFAPKAG